MQKQMPRFSSMFSFCSHPATAHHLGIFDRSLNAGTSYVLVNICDLPNGALLFIDFHGPFGGAKWYS